jgi:hypothetical protein
LREFVDYLVREGAKGDRARSEKARGDKEMGDKEKVLKSIILLYQPI